MTYKPKILILDANALLHRAWHALPPLTSPKGQVVNAVYGVVMIVMKMLQEQKPDAFVACWDTKAPTFRHEAYEAYKAGRVKQPDELYAQIPIVQKGLSFFGVESLSKDGYEADDLVATIAVRAKKDGWDAVIVTGDRDTLQIVQPGISVMAFKKGVTDTILYDEAEIEKQYHLKPAQFVDYKAMRGDPSDNIPGVPGIGEKGATDLLIKYGDLKGILKAAHDPESDLSASLRLKLTAGEKDLPKSLMLVKVKTDVDIDFDLKKRDEASINRDGLLAFMNEMGFKTLTKRFLEWQEGEASKDQSLRGSAKQSLGRLPRSSNSLAMTKGEFIDVTIENTEVAKTTLKEAREDGEIVIEAARGEVGSLFGSVVDGIVIGVGKELCLFTKKLLEKNAAIKKEMADLLADAKVKKIAHDCKDQMKALESLGFTVNGWTFDAMLAAYVLGAGERNHDLPSIAMRYAGIEIMEQAPAFRRAEAVMKLVEPLRRLLKAEHLESVLERFELPLIPVLRGMEKAGILIDKSYLTNLSHTLTEERNSLEAKMMKAAGRAFNPASPSQLAEVLFTDLKLTTKGIKKTKTGYSTAAAELEKLRGSNPIIELIEDHRELSKLLSTYVDVLPTLADKDGRVHTTFNQAVTATGRLSSSEPNMQNIPVRTELGRKIRRAFVATAGFRLVSCDYSQIELRLVAALAKDEKMLEAFRHGEDIHTATAAAIWNIDEDKVTKDQRRAAKAVNFGIIYGQGPVGLSVSAGITFAEAKGFIETYFDVYKGIKKYLDETKALANKLGYVETLFGRRRPLPEIQSMLPQLRSQAERMAINMPVQGTAADLMKLAMIRVHEKLGGVSKDAKLLLQVHDELVLEVPEAEVKTVAAFVKDTMENIEKVGVPIQVDVKSGKNWDEMEKI